MDVEFKIRGVALKLVTHIYLNCDTSLKVNNLEFSSLIDNNITRDDIIQAGTYLLRKKFIYSGGYLFDYSNNTIKCEITTEGIDWVEECNNVKL